MGRLCDQKLVHMYIAFKAMVCHGSFVKSQARYQDAAGSMEVK